MVIEERVVVHDIQDDEVRGCPDSVQDKVLSWDLGRRKKLETCTWIERETSLRFGELGGGGGGGVREFDLSWRIIEEAPA